VALGIVKMAGFVVRVADPVAEMVVEPVAELPPLIHDPYAEAQSTTLVDLTKQLL